MFAPLWADWITFILNSLIIFLSVILVFFILIQSGKGGGLAGAFGGPGGQSAFGSRSADQLTWYTVGLAAVWLLLVMFVVAYVPRTVIRNQPVSEEIVEPASSAPTPLVDPAPDSK
ncbi:MAG: preprotein translocase subunit SecG [Planctomycetota bacterium]|nr:preprotein translocase subunit SecG [Planctomycetota bacterium]